MLSPAAYLVGIEHLFNRKPNPPLRSSPQPQKEDMNLNVGKISDHLQIKITGEFIVETLGIEPVARDKRSMLFSEEQLRGEIIPRLIAHLDGMSISPVGDAPAKPATKRAKKAPKPGDADYDPFAQ